MSAFLEHIKNVPITDFACRIGFTLVRKGKYFSLKEHDSVMINTEKNCFWRNSKFSVGFKGGAGSIIDFAIEFNGASDVRDAMKQIAAMYGIEGEKAAKVKFEEPKIEKSQIRKEYQKGMIALPQKDIDNRRVYAYLLKTRKIEQSVIKYFLAKKMLYQDVHKNCVFHIGNIFGCLRGTDTTKRFLGDLEGSDYNECFYFRGKNDAKVLVVAESVIDIMSIMSYFCENNIRYVDYGYLALAGTNKINSVFYHIEKEQAEQRPYTHVLIATDVDKAGIKAANQISAELEKMGVTYEHFIPPKGKDWNDYLTQDN